MTVKPVRNGPSIRVVLVLVACALFLVTQASAQRVNRQYSSYVTPFPTQGVYRVLVLGDSLGEGLWAGLGSIFQGDRSVQLINKARWGTGISRRKYIGRPRELDPLLARIKPDIVVIAVGAKDAGSSIREGRKKYPFGSERWMEIYKSRLDTILQKLTKKNIAVYWVGLPIMRDQNFNENMNKLNDLFREKAHVNSIKFTDTWNGFIDQYGNFSPFGPDLDGRVVRLRSKDGIRFTRSGYRKLADYIARKIRRDLIDARSERNVPLAGNKAEQSLVGRKAGIGNLAKLNPDGSNAVTKTRKINSKSKSSSAAFGDIIASDRPSGLTLLSSITRVNDPSLNGGRHTLPLTLRPYYRVLIKGETLAIKRGRSDDFSANTLN